MPDMQKCLAYAAYSARFEALDQKEEMERLERDGPNPAALAQNNDDVNSTKAMGYDAKEDELDMQTMKNLLYKLLSLLAATGSQMHVIGEALEAEEAYGFYVGAMEQLLGQNTRPLCELYFWLAIYYFKDQYHLEKARLCFQKAYLILEAYNEGHDDLMKMAEININLGSVYKAQLKYMLSLEKYQKAMSIYEQVIGKGCLAYQTCLLEIAQIKFIQKRFIECLEDARECQQNLQKIFKNGKRPIMQKTELLINCSIMMCQDAEGREGAGIDARGLGLVPGEAATRRESQASEKNLDWSYVLLKEPKADQNQKHADLAEQHEHQEIGNDRLRYQTPAGGENLIKP